MNPTSRSLLGLRSWRFAFALAILLALPQASAWGAAEFTTDFRLEDCTWSAWGRQNPYLSLRPGRQLVLEGEEDGEELRVEITVLRELETISFQTANGVTLTVVDCPGARVASVLSMPSQLTSADDSAQSSRPGRASLSAVALKPPDEPPTL